MAQQATSKDAKPTLITILRLLLRLGPKQINDEIQLAIAQLKTKGIAAGIAAALIVVGLVFLLFLTVALIVAAIAALSLIFQLWAAALIVAGGFLLIAVIFAVIGLLRLRSTFPLIPEDAVRGFRLDLGTLQQGSSFDPHSLDKADERRRRSREEAAQRDEDMRKDSPGEGKPEKPGYAELLRRTAQRREHIASLKDSLQRRIPARFTPAGPGSLTVEAAPVQPEPVETATESEEPTTAQQISRRWGPLAVAAGSAAAGAALLRELIKR